MRKVLIIGAGPAGITAGYELMKCTGRYDVTILEEGSQVGGIARNVNCNNKIMDIGGHCFQTDSPKVEAWWKEILPVQGAPAYDDAKCGRTVALAEGGPNPETTDEVLLARNRVAHILYDNKFFDYPIRMNVNTLRNMGIGSSIKAGFDFVGNSVSRKKDTNLEHYYLNRFGKQLYKLFFESYIEKLWGVHPSKIDTAAGIQRIKGASVATVIHDSDRNHDNSAFFYPKLGPGQMWECAARKFEEMGGVIHRNCSVLKLNKENSKVKSVTCVMDGEPIEVEADIVISTMPLKELVMGMKDVPGNIVDIAGRLRYRDLVQVGLLLPRLNINVDASAKTLGNIVPDTWIFVQDKKRKISRIQIYNNWSPYLLEEPEKYVWVGCEFFCEEGDNDWNMSEEEWVRLAKQELSFLHVISSSTAVLDSHRECVKKAYPSYIGGYTDIDEMIQYLNSIRNLYCIGRNGQHKCYDMSYAMLSAFEAVKNITYNVESRENIWNVKRDAKEFTVGEADRRFQTSAPVPPKNNAYVPPAEVKTPSHPSAVPSAPVVSAVAKKPVNMDAVKEQVGATVTAAGQAQPAEEVRTSDLSLETVTNEEVKEEKLTFKPVEKMFPSTGTALYNANSNENAGNVVKKTTEVSQLRPSKIVHDAPDYIDNSAEAAKRYAMEEKKETTKFSIKKHETITEVPFKDVKLKDDMYEEDEAVANETVVAEEEVAASVSAETESIDVAEESELIADFEAEEIEEIEDVEDESVEETDDLEAFEDAEEIEGVEEEAEIEETEEPEEAQETEELEEAEEIEEAEETEETEKAEENEETETAEETEKAEEIEEAEAVEESEENEDSEEVEEAEAVEAAEEKEKPEEIDKSKLHPLIRNMTPAHEIMQQQVVKKSKERTPIPLAKDIEKTEGLTVSPSVVTAESIEKTAPSVKESHKKGEMEAVRQFERVLSIGGSEEVSDEDMNEEKRKAEEEAERICQEEERRKAEEEAERIRQEEERRKAEEAERIRQEEERRKAEEEAERLRLEEEERRKAEEEAERIRQEEERRKAEEEAERIRQEEERRKAEEEAERIRREEERRKAEEEAERIRQEEERRKAEEEAERIRQEEERRKAEEEAERIRQEEERRKAEEEAERIRQEEERRKAEEEAERIRQEEERRKAEEEAERIRQMEEKRKAEEAERLRQEEERRKAEEEAERIRQEEERRKAEEAERVRQMEEKRKAEEAERIRQAEVRRKAEEAQRAHLEAERRRMEESRQKDGRRGRRGGRRTEDNSPQNEVVGKTTTVGKITGTVIKARVVEVNNDEPGKRRTGERKK